MERPVARRIRLRHDRRRVQGSGAHRARRLGLPAAVSAAAGNAFDPREATFDRFNSWYGEPELEQKTVFVNAGYDFASGAHMYGWASWQDRDVAVGRASIAAPTIRRPQRDRRSIPTASCRSSRPRSPTTPAACGVRWKLGDWDMDSSLVYGSNEMEFTIENTLNRSLGTASQTVFDAGGFDYDQLVLNVSGVRSVEIGAFASPLNVAVGVEARREELLDLRRRAGLVSQRRRAARTARRLQSGAQVFPGFRPANEGDEDRTAVGAYVDLEANVTEQFLASVALRGESYSDFGENLVRQARRCATTSPTASRCAPRCRTASGRRRCSSSSSRRRRRTSSAACRSTSRRSR